MRDEARIVTNTLIAYAARFVVGGVSLVMVSYLLRHLGESTFGIIGIANSILQFVVLIELGVRPAVSRQLTTFLFGGEIERSNELVSTAFAVYCIFAGMILLVVGLGGDHFLAIMKVAPSLRAEAMGVLLLSAVTVCIALLRAPYDAALTANLRFDVLTLTDAGQKFVRALVVVAIFSLWQPRLLVWALGGLLAAIAGSVIIRRQALGVCHTLRIGRRAVSRRGLRDIAAFSVYTSLLQLSDWTGSQSGPLVISYFLGTAAVGHYTPAIAVVAALLPLSRSFLSQLAPVIAKAQATSQPGLIQQVLFRGTRYSLIITGGTMVLLATSAFSLVRVWLGKGFEDTGWVLVIWSASSLLEACVAGSVQIFIGTGKLRAMTIANILLAIGSICLAIYLVGWTSIGIAGTAIAVLAAQLIRTVTFHLYVTHISAVDRKRYFRESFLGPAVCLIERRSAQIMKFPSAFPYPSMDRADNIWLEKERPVRITKASRYRPGSCSDQISLG